MVVGWGYCFDSLETNCPLWRIYSWGRLSTQLQMRRHLTEYTKHSERYSLPVGCAHAQYLSNTLPVSLASHKSFPTTIHIPTHSQPRKKKELKFFPKNKAVLDGDGSVGRSSGAVPGAADVASVAGQTALPSEAPSKHFETQHTNGCRR